MKKKPPFNRLLSGLLVFSFFLLPRVSQAHDALKQLSPLTIQVKELNNYAIRAGLSKDKIEALVADVLKEGGVELNQNTETPELDVVIGVVNFFGGYAGSYRLQLRDWAGSLKDPSKRLLVSTWEKGGILTASKKKFRAQIEAELKQSALVFVKEYKAAN